MDEGADNWGFMKGERGRMMRWWGMILMEVPTNQEIEECGLEC
jgi:hypothetical protein